jgi:two-component system, cell cycle sensor histidine kinase and response regulator CckA
MGQLPEDSVDKVMQRLNSLEVECRGLRQALQKQASEPEFLFEALAENTNALIFVYQSSHLIYANPKFVQTFGFNQDDLFKKPCYAFMNPQLLTLLQNLATLDLLPSTKPKTHELTVRSADNETRHFCFTANSVLYKGKKAVLAHGLEITEQKKESGGKYRALTDSIPAIICALNPEGFFTYVNSRWESSLGHKSEELAGKQFVDFIVPDQRLEIRHTLEKAVQEERATPAMQLKMVHKNGEEKSLLMSAAPYIDEHGGSLGMVTIIQDTIPRKHVEDYQWKAQKMEAIERLAGGIAHDFNNILQSIQSYSQLLLMAKSKDDPDCIKLKNIEKCTQRAGQLTKQLLAFSQKAEAKFTSVNVNELLGTAKEFLDKIMPGSIIVTLSLSEGLQLIRADASHLEQMIMTLAVNAQEAMPQGGKFLIETKSVTLDENYCLSHSGVKPGNYVLIAITDSGSGIDPDVMEHIFEPFYTTKEVGKGTGLGLAMVYGIVKSHGGHITSHSDQSTGTTFKIYLPLIPEKPDQAEEDVAEVMPSSGGGQGTILLVDDEESLRQVGQEFLEIQGYTVITAATGEEALEIYKRRQASVDLVLLDLIMPGMGGRACLKKILQLNPSQKVVIASGFSANAQAQEVIEDGALSFLNKPYDLPSMVKIISDVLSIHADS